MLSMLKNKILMNVPLDVGSAIGAGASLIGASKMGKSADAAAKAQAAMYDRTRADLLPYKERGASAANELMRLLGLSVAPVAPNRARYGDDVASYRNALADYERRKGEYADALASDDYGSLMRNFTGEDVESEPGYQFGMDQGMQAMDRSAAARGNLLSGASLKAAQRFGQDYAGTKFNDAYQRDNNNKNRAFNWLMGLTTMGQNSTVQQATTNQQVGNNLSNLAIQQGNAQAAGIMGVANSAQNYQNNQFQNQLLANMNNNRLYSAPSGGGGWNMGDWGIGNGSDSWG